MAGKNGCKREVYENKVLCCFVLRTDTISETDACGEKPVSANELRHEMRRACRGSGWVRRRIGGGHFGRLKLTRITTITRLYCDSDAYVTVVLNVSMSHGDKMLITTVTDDYGKGDRIVRSTIKVRKGS